MINTGFCMMDLSRILKNKFKTKKVPKYLDHDINRPNLDDIYPQYEEIRSN